MKKLIVIALALLVGAQANAQLVGKVAFVNATDKATLSSLGTSTDDLNGIGLGAEYKLALPFVDGLGVAPGAMLDILFGKDGDTKLRDIALDIPVHLTYAYEITNDLSVYGFGGPALRVGLGKTASYTFGGTTNTTDYYNKDYNYTYNRLMLLLGLGAGIEVADMIQVSVGVDFGVTPFYNSNNLKATRPYQIKIGVGYLF